MKNSRIIFSVLIGSLTGNSFAQPVAIPNLHTQTITTHTEQEIEDNGDFVESSTVNDANGTEKSEANSKETSNHWTDKGKTVKTKKSISVDPKGLGNKQKVEIDEKVVTHPDGSEERTVIKEVNGTTVSEEMKKTHK
jgi:hypothetical protein